MADYIYPGPGAPDKEVVLKIRNVATGTRYVGEDFEIPSLQDVTVNAANDVFTWTQLDAAAKKQIATTATNSLGMNLVVNQDTFFGKFTTVADDAGRATWLASAEIGDVAFQTDTSKWYVCEVANTTEQEVSAKPALAHGILGLSTNKVRVEFDLYFGDTSSATEGKFIQSKGYITGLAPTVSADAPVWVTPITITVDEDYTVTDATAFPTS